MDTLPSFSAALTVDRVRLPGLGMVVQAYEGGMEGAGCGRCFRFCRGTVVFGQRAGRALAISREIPNSLVWLPNSLTFIGADDVDD